MPLPSLSINGQDLEALGLRVETVDGPWDLPDVTDPTIIVPGLSGAVRTGAPSTVAPRTIAITGVISKDPAILTKLDLLKSLFALGILEVTLATQTARVYQTRVTSFKTKWVGPAFASNSAELTVTLLCTDPIAYDLNPICVAFWGAPIMCPVGTAPSAGHVLSIMAPFTNAVVTVRAASGEPVHSLGLTRAGTAGLDYEEIDIDLFKLTRSQSGAKTSDANALTSGDPEAFVISPEDGDAILGIGPTVECAGLSAKGGAELTYYRGWF